MKVSIDKKAKTVTIVMPLENPKPSASGKNLVLCSTRGNKTADVEYDGKAITVGLNVYVPAD
jgi:hypothetical protein